MPVHSSRRRYKMDDGFRVSYTFMFWFLLLPLWFTPEIARMTTGSVLPFLPVELAFIFFIVCWFLIKVLKHSISGAWKKACSLFLAPPLAAGLIILLSKSGFDTEWICFQISKSHYQALVRQTSFTEGAPRQVKFDYGQLAGLTSPNFFYTLVYEENDKLYEGVRLGRQTSIRNMGDHFYIVEEVIE